ncbi:MAG: hypothetical protein AB7S26_42990 [Sandaracinaceae bacterium]
MKKLKRTDGCRVYADLCPEHGFVHGAEAAELRAGIEDLVGEYFNPNASSDDCEDLRKALEALLDRVDARDSLAHLEAMSR